MGKESFTVVYDLQPSGAEPNVASGTKPALANLTGAETLPNKEWALGFSATIVGAKVVTLEAETAAEALKAVRALYRCDSGRGFAVKTSAVTLESI